MLDNKNNTQNNFSRRPKVLFLHTTITWYRIPFFKALSDIINVKYIFTKVSVGEKEYNLRTNYNELKGLNYEILNNKSKIQWKIFHTVLHEDYDVIIVPVLDGFGETIDAIISFILAKIRKKPISYFWERWDPPIRDLPLGERIKKYIKKGVFKFFIKWADVCIVPGTKSYEYFSEAGVKNDRIFIAPDASEIIEYNKKLNVRDTYGIDKSSRIILYFGRIIKRKGLDYLIKAFKELESKYSDIHLLICGEGEFKAECIEIANELNIKNITFVGSVDPEERAAYFEECNIFVLPSYFAEGMVEPWGLTINEVMQFSKPVIATTAVGAAYDMIINGQNGYIIEERNLEQLVKSLDNILISREIEIKMGLQSKEIVENGFKYMHMADGFKKALLWAFNDENISN